LWGVIGLLLIASRGFSSTGLVILLLSGALPGFAWLWAIGVVRSQQATGKTLQEIQALTQGVFEDWVAARFRDLGFRVKSPCVDGYRGVDLFVEQTGETAVVQCKNYKSWAAGESVLHDLLSAMHYFGANQAYLVTSGRVTTAATEWAKGKPIEIWDGEHLARLSRQLAVRHSRTVEIESRPDVLASNAS
jgi:restriction system protein